MQTVDYACPKCGDVAVVNLPPAGARVECPGCGAGIFLKPPKTAGGPRAAGKGSDRPRKGRKTEPAAAARGRGRAWAVGAAALLVVAGVALALTRGRPDDQAAAPPPVPAAGPEAKMPQGGDPATAPKKNPPKVDPPKVDPPTPPPPRMVPPVTLPVGDIDENWPALPPRRRQPEPADAPNRTTVRWYAPTAGGGPLVVLELPTEPFPPRPGPHRGLLARELARQALLLAAREEFGAATRDAALREVTAEPPGYKLAGTFELAWVVVPGKGAAATLSATAGDAPRRAWQLDIPLPDADVLDYARLASALEGAARGPLADALAKETKAPRLPARASDAAAPVDVAAGLAAVNYFDLYAAVRKLHAARTGGESPARLVGLARGYATLGLLTEHLDIAAHKAFKARGLLYAHRAVARGAPGGGWALAFASCLSGFHKQALEQVAAAAGPPPGWAKVVAPACRQDHAALKALPPDEAGPLADVLRFVVAENRFTASHPTGIGLEVLRLTRDCFRVHDGIAKIGDLGVIRTLSDAGPGLVSGALSDRVGKFPDLPAAAAAVLGKVRAGDAAAERAMLRAMDAAGGPGEPSLGCLAALVREERYRLLGHRLEIFVGPLGLETAVPGEVRRALPFLEDHPRVGVVAAYLEVEVVDRKVAAATKLPTSEIQFGGWGYLLDGDGELYGFPPGSAAALAHADDADPDLRERPARVPVDDWVRYTETFRKVSPHSAVARFHITQNDWPRAEPEAAAWETEFAGHPALMAALAQRFLDSARPDAAERLYRAAARLAPENLCYFALAGIYQKVRKDEAMMLAALEERLKHPDYGLECARMRVSIAEVYARRKDFKTAQAYAEKAAEDSGADWALSSAARYAGEAGDKARAAMWERRRQERYGGGLPPAGLPKP